MPDPLHAMSVRVPSPGWLRTAARWPNVHADFEAEYIPNGARLLADEHLLEYTRVVAMRAREIAPERAALQPVVRALPAWRWCASAAAECTTGCAALVWLRRRLAAVGAAHDDCRTGWRRRAACRSAASRKVVAGWGALARARSACGAEAARRCMCRSAVVVAHDDRSTG